LPNNQNQSNTLPVNNPENKPENIDAYKNVMVTLKDKNACDIDDAGVNEIIAMAKTLKPTDAQAAVLIKAAIESTKAGNKKGVERKNALIDAMMSGSTTMVKNQKNFYVQEFYKKNKSRLDESLGLTASTGASMGKSSATAENIATIMSTVSEKDPLFQEYKNIDDQLNGMTDAARLENAIKLRIENFKLSEVIDINADPAYWNHLSLGQGKVEKQTD
jgi:hypothetical protein